MQCCCNDEGDHPILWEGKSAPIKYYSIQKVCLWLSTCERCEHVCSSAILELTQTSSKMYICTTSTKDNRLLSIYCWYFAGMRRAASFSSGRGRAPCSRMCTFWSSFGRSQFTIVKCGEILRGSGAKAKAAPKSAHPGAGCPPPFPP